MQFATARRLLSLAFITASAERAARRRRPPAILSASIPSPTTGDLVTVTTSPAGAVAIECWRQERGAFIPANAN